MRPPRSVSFTHPPTLRARVGRAAAALWGFLRWMVRGPAGPSLRWVPVGIGLWLLAGAPNGRYSSTPSLHGDERIIATIIGLTLIVGLFWLWLTMVRGTSDDLPQRRPS